MEEPWVTRCRNHEVHLVGFACIGAWWEMQGRRGLGTEHRCK